MFLEYKESTSTSECSIIPRCLHDPAFIPNVYIQSFVVRIPDLNSYVMQQFSDIGLAAFDPALMEPTD